LQFLLDLIAIVRSIMIPLMQDQPDLETWIRSCDPDAILFTKIDRFFISLMVISIEHSPNLILSLEQILAPSTALDQTFCFRVFQRFSSDC